MMRKFLLMMLASLFLAACGRDSDDDVPTIFEDDDDVDIQVAAVSLFDRIDAETMMVMANLEPMPDSLADTLYRPLSAAAEMNRVTAEQLGEEIDDPLARALLNELAAIDSREAVEARGLHSNGLYALHTVSVYPFMHWQLIDREALEATLDRLAGEAGIELPRRDVDGEQIIWAPLAGMGLAIHMDEDFVTAALVPDSPALLRRVVNLDQPAQAMSRRGLARFNRERGFTAYGSGYIDFTRLLSLVFNGDERIELGARRDERLQALSEDAACRSEIEALVNTFPRLSTGSTRVDERRITALMRIETAGDMGQRLATIADTSIGVGARQAELFDAGVAINLVAARDFARELVGGWVDNPPQCELFAEIGEQAGEWQLALNRPIPPVVTNIQGFRLNVDRVVMGGPAGVVDGAGTLALFMHNPQMLIGMAQMFSPELAALDLRPGGEPQPIPPGMIPDMPELSAWVALGEEGLGIAIGEGHKDELGQALSPGETGSAILAYGINMQRYAEMLSAVMEEALAEEGMEELDPTAMLRMLGEVYEYYHTSLHLRPEGIDVVADITLAR